ncbi:hypothetical protein PLESTB_001169200 [Pleodorina starrii]|uniref:Uncharacterized protein n=1 Tax=Pleodorina starrii TaxID=330485 RepID=A0A9W6BRM7_9CHLO|nr:hypothetical protein PLESTM_000245000 [Pleodorina starrii]GLC56972.1 hypothetical protein PLESTB_001169200 [Pleodorina starrii]GLC64806.1 hypothetical protein PLESTF_000209500 [Pleodorina starrii]
MSKAAPKGKGTKKDRGPLLAAHAEALRTGLGTTPDGQLVKGKLTAALNIWSMVLGGEDEREEVFKAGICPLLHTLLERGDVEERHAAMGCLSVLAQSEKHVAEVVTHRVIATAAALLMFDHARGKLPSVQLLRLCAARQEFASKVADVALPALVEVLKSDGLPGWGQMRQAQTHAAHTLKLLLENVEGEPPEIRQARRGAVLQLGAVAPLAAMVATAPRLPPPALMPAPPPVMTKKKGSAARKKESSKQETPLGTRDAAATVASACLRYLSLVPEFVEEFMRTGSLPGIIRGLQTCGEEQAAFLTGVLWETSAESHVAEAAVAAGGVVALLHVISRHLAGCRIGKPKKAPSAKKAGDKKDGKGSRAASPNKKDGKDGKDGKSGKGGKGKSSSSSADVVNFADATVCNATGTLQHLTFLDDAKHQVALHGGVPILNAALKVSNPQTYENASGALWNVGLDVRNSLMLQAAGAPPFLARPVPEPWLTRGGELVGSSDSDDDDEAGGPMAERSSPRVDAGMGAGRDRVFLTQQ